MENRPNIDPPLPPRSGEQLTVDQSRRYRNRLRLYQEWRHMREERRRNDEAHTGRQRVGMLGMARMLMTLNLRRQTNPGDRTAKIQSLIQRVRSGRLRRVIQNR